MKKSEWPLALLVLAVGVAYWNLLLPSPLQPYIAFDLEISLSKAAQLVTASAAAAVVTLLAYGVVGDKVKPKLVIVTGLAALTIGSGLASITDDYELLLAVRIFNGMADGCIYAAAWVAITDYLPKGKYGFGIRWLLIGTALSAIGGLPLANEWAGSGSWQSAFRWFTLAGGSMTVLSLGLFFAKERAHEEEATGGFRAILQDSHLKWLIAANIAVAVSWFGLLTFVGGFLARTYQPSTSDVNAFFAAAGGAFVLGSFINSQDPKVQRWITFVLGTLVVPMAIVFFGFTEGFWTTAGIACFYAAIRAPGLAIMETWLLEAAEQKAARVPAIVCVDLGPAVGTLVAAAIGGIVLSQTAYVGIGSVFSAAALVSLGFLATAFRARSNLDRHATTLLAKAEVS